MDRQNKKITPDRVHRKTALKRLLAVVLGAGVLASGSLLVFAGDGPDIYSTVVQYAPSRRAAPVAVQRFEAPLPRIFRQREAPPSRALGFAPSNNTFAPLNRLDRPATAARDFPRGAIDPLANPVREPRVRNKPVRKEARRKLHDSSQQIGAGISTATNYCVRTCDGFAFPIGNTSGNSAVQEVACRTACPGAETLLYSAPAGAKDFDAMSRGGVSYSALPGAFRYREKLDSACRCHAPGHATNPLAVVADLTLRQGDLVMSRAGMRHFNGSASLPYRARNFSDAVLKLESKREIQIVRGMEIASVRGILSPRAPNFVKERLVAHVREVEREAKRESALYKPQKNLGRGFLELRAREAKGPTTLKTVQRKVGIVALN